MNRLTEILHREFGLAQMGARAARKNAVAQAKFHLDQWADYGEPRELERAKEILLAVQS